jgi:putative oxidoreductase
VLYVHFVPYVANNTKEVLKVTFIAGFGSRSDQLELSCLHQRRWPLQKLFSAFPAGWPGLGLLLLRMLVGVTLIAQTVTQVRSSELSASGWLLAALILLGAGCLLLGFVTPVTAIVIGLVSLTFPFSSLAQTVDIVVLSAVIALLGPGAFSIDARMFGRREILITHASRSPKP